ncbi:MAG: hypothetical protein MJZ13_09410 [Bacteroidales bacterium]|nr:hypothetical protein [Bacteroidales bacterium]
MKKTFLTIIAAIIGITAFAQQTFQYSITGRAEVEGSMSALAGERQVRLVIDYSEGYFNGFNEKKAEENFKDWKEDKVDAYSDAVETLEDACRGKRIYGDIEKAKYTLVFKILKGTDDIEDLLADVLLKDSENNVICTIKGIEGSDMDNLAKRVGRYIKNVTKK